MCKDQETQLRSVIEAYIARSQVAAAHICAANWSSKYSHRSDAGLRLQQHCFALSPYVSWHHPGIEVFVCSRGFGVRAREFIGKHEPVLFERPAVNLTGTMTQQPDWVAKYLDGGILGSQGVTEILEGLYPRTDKEVWHIANKQYRWLGKLGRKLGPAGCSLRDPVRKMASHAGRELEVAQLLGRISVNAHDDGVYLIECFVNHSCVPNCENRATRHVRLRTTRDVSVGEELTIPYMAHLTNLFGSQPQRQEAFENSWGTKCTCSRCTAEEGDKRSRRFEEKIIMIEMPLTNKIKVDALAAQVQRLLSGKMVPLDMPWKQDKAHLLIHEVLKVRLVRGSIPKGGNDLKVLGTALLQMHERQTDILGESSYLAPLRRTLEHLARVYMSSAGPLPSLAVAKLAIVQRIGDLCGDSSDTPES